MTEEDLRQIPMPKLPRHTADEMQLRSSIFFKSLSLRRAIRDFSDKPVEK